MEAILYLLTTSRTSYCCSGSMLVIFGDMEKLAALRKSACDDISMLFKRTSSPSLRFAREF